MARGSLKSDFPMALRPKWWTAEMNKDYDLKEAKLKADEAREARIAANPEKHAATQAKRKATLAAKKAEKERPAKEAAELQRRADMDPKSPWTEEQLKRRADAWNRSTSGYDGITPTFAFTKFGRKPFAAKEVELDKLAVTSPTYKVIKENWTAAAGLLQAITEYQGASNDANKRAVLAAWRSAPEEIRKMATADKDIDMWRGGRPEGKAGRTDSLQSFTANPGTAMNFGKAGKQGAIARYSRDVASSEAVIDTRKLYNLLRPVVNQASTNDSYMEQSYLWEREYIVIKPKFKDGVATTNDAWYDRAKQEGNAALKEWKSTEFDKKFGYSS